MGIRTKKKISMGIKVLIGLMYISPVIIGVIFSFHPNQDFLKGTLTLLPEKPTVENYVYVFKNIPTVTYFKNTLIMVLICVPCQMVLNTIAAYAFSYFEFPFKNLIFTIFLTSMMIPGEVTLISNYISVQKMGLINTYLGMTITSLTGVGGIFMLRQSMKSLPMELWEAAKMDGCGKIKYLYKVIFPLSKPIISALAINSFIGVYDAYLWPLMVTRTNAMHNVQIGMANLMSGSGARFGIELAGAVVSMLIPISAFIFGQDYIVKGMTAGAVKS